MTAHMQREIETLKRRILTLCGVVEDTVERAVQAVRTRDAALAQQIVEADEAIDRTEVDVEEECLKVLALHQPVAADLRFVIAVLKINGDLERVGDMAANIAERAIALADYPALAVPAEIEEMMRRTLTMLRQSLDALMTQDALLARTVIASDDAVDDLTASLHRTIEAAIVADPANVAAYIQMLSTGRHLERIADSATNIAEDVIYLIGGDIVRHRPLPPVAE